MGLVGEDGQPVKSDQPGAPPNAGDANVPQESLTPEQFEEKRVEAIAEALADFSEATLDEAARKALAAFLIKNAEAFVSVLDPALNPRVTVELKQDGHLAILGPRDPGSVKRLLQAALEEVQFTVFKTRIMRTIAEAQAGVKKPGLSDVLRFGKRGL